MPIARLSLVSLLALSLAACGGRVIGDLAVEEGDGATSDTATSFEGGGEGGGDDGGPIIDDGLLEDSSIPVDDTSIIPIDDTSIPSMDSGVIVVDSGKIDSSITDTGVLVDAPPVDTSIVDTGVVDTGMDLGTDVGPPITTVCDKFATATCTPAFQTCCTSHGFAWDSLGCTDVARLWCKDSVNGASTGKNVYNPAYADACAAAWSSATMACSMSLVDWIKNRVPCAQTFNGKTAPGGTCTRDSDCHADAGAIGICDESSKKCRQFAIVNKGAACNYFGINPKICDKGLYCNFTTGSVPVCATATPLGGSCFGIDDTSCGLGYSCKGGKCTTGSPVGATCTRDLECASWSCSFGKCTDPNVLLASKALCSGI